MAWGLYIHVPFCRRKCPYCDFYSVANPSQQAAFVNALISETAMRALPDAVFDTIYIGGGTPSVLAPAQIARILDAARVHFSVVGNAEITMEANPGTVTEKSLAECRAAGVNRINIGVQSFNDANLAFLGRIHSAGDAAEALHAAGRAGFDNIGLDLIYGLPGQNKGGWQKDLAAAAAFVPAHISCYMLTFEPGTKMTADRDAGKFALPSEERVSAMFVQAVKYLAGRGYEHYEISNFAGNDAVRSRHNSKYWQNVPYIGLGPSAHTYIEPGRSWNCRDVDAYINAISAGRLPRDDAEQLTAAQMMIEAVYLGLRQTRGIDVPAFEKRFGVDFEQMFAPAAAPFVEDGQMVFGDGLCRLTRQGMLVLDSIVDRMVRVI